jgi:hypothetical protein
MQVFVFNRDMVFLSIPATVTAWSHQAEALPQQAHQKGKSPRVYVIFREGTNTQVFSPGILRIELRMNRSGSDVEILQMYSQGVRPFRDFSLRAKL